MNKFVKIAGALLFTVCAGTTSFAKVIDENTAKTIGSNFLVSTYPDGVVKSAANLVTSYVATTQSATGTLAEYYVFNVVGGTGFVMVSADDNIIPILAYSSEASFDINTMSPSAKEWIDGYKFDIAKAVANQVPAQAGTRDKWNELSQVAVQRPEAKRTTSSFPSSSYWLLGTLTWDQAPGYNASCPGGSVTGCVATAMAQVMKFWNWPTIGAGSHSYKQYPAAYPTQNVDFGITAYNWTDMSAHLTSADAAVATLMYHCGVSVEMNYSTTESGTYVIELESTHKINNAEFALKTFFHYKRTLVGVPRGGESGAWPNDPTVPALTDPMWIAMLKAELNAGRPVIYSGNSTSSGGHCWVCDGYDVSSNMHFNFGWSGTGPDGFYSINAVNPPALGVGGGGGNFINDQCAIIGIQPDSFPTFTGNIRMNSNLDCKTSSPTPYPAVFTATATIMNAGSSSFSGDFCAQVFDTNLVYVGTVQTITGQTIAAGASSASLSFSPAATLYQMVPGPYHMRIMYRPTGTTTWTPVGNFGIYYNENLIEVANTTYVTSGTGAPAYDGMEVGTTTTIVGGTTLKTGKPVTINSSVQNLTSGAFNGSVQVALTNVVTGTVTPIQVLTGQSIFYNATNPVAFAGTVPATLASGTYTLSIMHQPGGTGAFVLTGGDFYENPVVVNVVNAAGITTPSSVDGKISVYPNPANSMVTISMDNVSVSKIRITDIMGHEVQTLYPDNQSVMTVNVNNYAAGIYFVNLFAGDEVVTRKIVVTK